MDLGHLKDSAERKSPFPKEKKNNQLFFKYPYIFIWREEDLTWFPLHSDRMSDPELKNMRVFIEEEYPKYLGTEDLSLKELSEDLSKYLKGVIKKDSIMEFCLYVEKASLSEVLGGN